MSDAERSAANALTEHRSFVRALARGLVGGADGDDVAQETLLAGLTDPPRRERAWRSWLRRALGRLRERLDSECGGRSAWAQGLLPLLRWNAAPMTAPPLVATGVTVGVTWMSAKGVVAVIAAAAVAAAAWWTLLDGIGRATPDRSPLLPDVARVATEGPLARPTSVADGQLASPERAAVAAEDGTGGGNGPHADAASLPPGEVAFRIVDGESGRPLDGVSIRFLHDTRFAQYDGSGEGRAKLSSGSWTARVTAAGFEPADLGGFTVAIGAVTELATIALARGGGRIEGRVTARQLSGNGGVVVELRGAGRAPCEECRRREEALGHFKERLETMTEAERQEAESRPPPTPGDCCGWGPKLTTLPLAGGGDFAFRGLAAGVYWLRAVDPVAALVDSRRVEIGRNGAAWVELEISAPTTLAVELRHADGHHFTGAWTTPHRAEPAAIAFKVRLGEKASGQAVAQPSVDDVLLTMGPPIPIGAQEEAASEAEGGLLRALRTALDLKVVEEEERRVSLDALLSFATVHHEAAALLVELESCSMIEGQVERDRLDRAREESDALVADDPPPDLPVVELTAQAERPERFLLGPLPREQLMVEVKCGRFASEPIAVDLRFGFVGPLVVTMVGADDGSGHASRLEGVAASCMSCHDAGGAAGDR